MKTLIYTVALGHPVFGEMAQECALSARRQGYRGDLVVLTDAPESSDVPTRAAPRSRKVAASFDIVRVPESGDSGIAAAGLHGEMLGKAAVTRVLDAAALAAYDRVLYVDSDCVFARAPENLLAHDGLRLACEGDTMSRYNLVFFDDDERARFLESPQPRINTGTVQMPGAAAFDFLAEWEAHWRACPREATRRDPEWNWCHPALMDQPALQRMLFRGCRPWDVFPPGLVRFPLYEEPRDATLLHFCGPLHDGRTPHVRNKIELLRRMRGVNAGFVPPSGSVRASR